VLILVQNEITHRLWSLLRSWLRKNCRSPHRTRLFKLANDPQFAEKLLDIAGPYVAPPEHVVVLSIDEKSQIQVLDNVWLLFG
jgi:hypothetical protein